MFNVTGGETKAAIAIGLASILVGPIVGIPTMIAGGIAVLIKKIKLYNFEQKLKDENKKLNPQELGSQELGPMQLKKIEKLNDEVEKAKYATLFGAYCCVPIAGAPTFLCTKVGLF